MPSGPTKTSRKGDSRRAFATVAAAEEASGAESAVGREVDGSEGGSGWVSIGVWNMVKHSVPLCCANVATVSSFRRFPRPAICRGRAAAGLSLAVCLAGPRADVARLAPEFRPSSAHLFGRRTMEERGNGGTPGILAFGSRHWHAFRRTRRPSPRARRLRSGPLATLLPRRRSAASGASRLVVAGITPAFTGCVPVPVLRCHARSLALVRGAPSLRERRRIHRARALLLFAGHDRQRGWGAESG